MKKLTRKIKLELVMQYAKSTWEKSELHERQQYTFKVISVSLIAPDTFRIVNKAIPINRKWEAESYVDSVCYFTFRKEMNENGDYTGNYEADTNYYYTNNDKNILWA